MNTPEFILLDPERETRLQPGQKFKIAPGLTNPSFNNTYTDIVASYNIYVLGIGQGKFRLLRLMGIFEPAEEGGLVRAREDSLLLPAGNFDPKVIITPDGLVVTPESCPLMIEASFDKELGRKTYTATWLEMVYQERSYRAEPSPPAAEIPWKPRGRAKFAIWSTDWIDPEDHRAKLTLLPPDRLVLSQMSFAFHKERSVRLLPLRGNFQRQLLPEEPRGRILRFPRP